MDRNGARGVVASRSNLFPGGVDESRGDQSGNQSGNLNVVDAPLVLTSQ